MAGARHSAADNKLIQDTHDNAVKLGATCASGEKSVLAVTIRDGLAALSAQHKSIKGLDYANVEAWDIQNGAQALSMLASIASSEAAQEEPEHVQFLCGIIDALLAWLGAEVAEMNTAAAQPEAETEEKSLADALLVFQGGEIKALGDGKIGGYLVRFGDAEHPDLSAFKDFFTADTYFGAHAGDGVDTTLNHGVPLAKGLEEYADRMLPPIKTRKDKVGIFAEVVLDLRNAYEKMVHDLGAAGKLSWSSGAVKHLVKRTRMPNGTNRIDRWIIGEAALTPTPAEPRNTTLQAVKTLADRAGQPAPDGAPAESQAAAQAREFEALKESNAAVFGRYRK